MSTKLAQYSPINAESWPKTLFISFHVYKMHRDNLYNINILTLKKSIASEQNCQGLKHLSFQFIGYRSFEYRYVILFKDASQ